MRRPPPRSTLYSHSARFRSPESRTIYRARAMTDDPRVQHLIDELLASTATPKEVCQEGRVGRVFYEAHRGGSHGRPRKDSHQPTQYRAECRGRKPERSTEHM